MKKLEVLEIIYLVETMAAGELKNNLLTMIERSGGNLTRIKMYLRTLSYEFDFEIDYKDFVNHFMSSQMTRETKTKFFATLEKIIRDNNLFKNEKFSLFLARQEDQEVKSFLLNQMKSYDRKWNETYEVLFETMDKELISGEIC